MTAQGSTAGRWSAGVYALPAALLVLVVFSWFVTYGTWRFLDPEGFGDFYDAQARSLIKGRLDVPWNAIDGEALVRDGKAYGYFGPTPALPRIALNSLVPGMYGRWSRLSLLLACGVNLLACWLLLQHVRAELYPSLQPTGTAAAVYSVFLLAAGLGTTNIFLASCSYTYHEAIIWSAALALLSYVSLLRYGSTHLAVDLLLAILFCCACWFTRVPVGAGTATALGLALACGVVRRVRHAAVLAGSLAGLAVSSLAWNQLKFGSAYEFLPIRLHVQYSPQRLRAIDGTLFHPENAWFTFRQYFLQPNIRFRPSFPWLYCRDRVGLNLSGVKLDLVEPFAGLTAATPPLLALSLVGFMRLLRRRHATPAIFGISVASSALSGAALLAYAVISQRYLHDFYPFLIIAGAIGVHQVLSWQRLGLKRIALTALCAAATFSIWANTAFTFTYQGEIVWGVPLERKKALRSIKHRIDSVVGPNRSLFGSE